MWLNLYVNIVLSLYDVGICYCVQLSEWVIDWVLISVFVSFQ